MSAPAPRLRSRPRQAVILAGGRGERMRAVCGPDTPKHMLVVEGRPFAAHLVERLAAQGFDRVLFLLGWQAARTTAWFGAGERFGVEIGYDIAPEEYESAARLRHAFPRLDAAFLLCYCDNLWPLRFLDLWQKWRQAGTLAQVAVYGNADGYTRNNVRMDEAGRIAIYDPTRTAEGLNGVEIGYALMERSVAGLIGADEQRPLAAALYPRLAASAELAAYPTGHRYYSAGSPERLELTRAFLAAPKAVLLDRDGVLNRRPAPGDYVKSWAEWEWLPGAREALELFRNSGHRVIVVSNQAGVGRGVMTRAALDDIHARMRAEAPVDAIYVCPHDWEAGCACRKPKPGMLYQAQRDFHLDLTRTWYLGDDARDAQAAEAAGCLYAEVSERAPLIGYARAWTGTRETGATETAAREETPCVS